MYCDLVVLTNPPRTIHGAVTFQSGAGYANLARCQPSKYTLSGGAPRAYVGIGGNTPVNFTLFIKVKACNLIRPLGAHTGNHLKKVDGLLLAGESGRVHCIHGMILDVDLYTAPCGLGAHTFGGEWRSLMGEHIFSIYHFVDHFAKFSYPVDAPSNGGRSSPQKKSGSSRFQDTSSCTPNKDFRAKTTLAKKPWEDGMSNKL